MSFPMNFPKRISIFVNLFMKKKVIPCRLSCQEDVDFTESRNPWARFLINSKPWIPEMGEKIPGNLHDPFVLPVEWPRNSKLKNFKPVWERQNKIEIKLNPVKELSNSKLPPYAFSTRPIKNWGTNFFWKLEIPKGKWKLTLKVHERY